MTVASHDFLDRLIAHRDRLRSHGEAILEHARAEKRDKLTDQEDVEFRELIDDLKSLDERIAEGRAEVKRAGNDDPNLKRIRAAENKKRRGTVSTRVFEPQVYTEHSRDSYMRDLILASTNMDYDGSCRDRLMRHSQDVESGNDYREFRDLSRADGQGGYAVPPAWLMNQFMDLARPGRAFANVVTNQPLPGGTDSINIPRLATGTATGVQTTDNTNVVEQDLTDAFINVPVRTIAGQQDIAIQLIDQSPIAFDEIVFRDLVADHAAQTDGQVLAGTGANGQVLGVHGTPGITTVAVGALTTAGVYSAIADAVQRVHTQRYLPPTAIVMHPRRWAWFLTLLDGNQRPLFLPTQNNPSNAMGTVSAVAAEQVVGQMHGLPVITDPAIGTIYGAGSNEDLIYVLRASDLVLWESGIRTRVLPETLSGQLTVRLQIYGYLAFSAARYPASIVEITGLTAPTF